MPQVKTSICPKCFTILSAATNMDDENLRPKPGDVTVCLYCAEVLVFNEDLTLRRPLAGEIEDPDGELARHVAAVKAIQGI